MADGAGEMGLERLRAPGSQGACDVRSPLCVLWGVSMCRSEDGKGQ